VDKLLITHLQQFFNMDHIVLAGRGSIGIYSALKVWSKENSIQSPVAVQASVCQDVIAAILISGREIIFCDVDPATGHAPLHEWRRAWSEGARVAIVVHLYGNPANTKEIKEIFKEGLVIDDAAQALGAMTPNGLAGTCGDIGIISFGPTKHINVGGAALIFADHSFAK